MLQAAKTSAPTEVLAGLVERVTFHNPENGFCVLRVKARGQRELITILGHAAVIAAGEFVQARGTWVNDRTHGVQFRASFLKAMPPTTTEGIEKYLGSGMIRGIGPVYAKKLVRAFAEAVFEIIEQEPSLFVPRPYMTENDLGGHRRSLLATQAKKSPNLRRNPGQTGAQRLIVEQREVYNARGRRDDD
jgi:ATP-dependent exoDNAse (exonuclease V) alpha subunit